MSHTPFDAQDYLHHLEAIDLSESDKTELIDTLWLIAQCFVDHAYAPAPTADRSSLKCGFEAANVIDLQKFRQPRTDAANDNGKADADKGAA